MRRRLRFEISRQPDDETCGATCLQAVYRHFGDELPLAQLIAEIPRLEAGGTLAVLLASHALRRGYRAALYTYNLQVFDPTWFGLDRGSLAARLREQLRHKSDPKLEIATAGYLELLELGGELRFVDLSQRLIRKLLDRELPVLTGLSATYLYRTPRELGPAADYDDVRGEPAGHFVVLCGYDERAGKVAVADPLHPQLPSLGKIDPDGIYEVSVERLITAVLLGVLTYDANLLQLEPGAGGRRRKGAA